jgi:hypothetical protein
VESLWPWAAVAGAGALHGLNPASGWWLARDGTPLRRRLAVLGAGHLAAVAVVAASVPLGLRVGIAVDRGLLQGAAVVLWLGLAMHFCLGRRIGGAAGWWSFATSVAHCSGLMLVPAILPLCADDWPGREITAAGSLGSALAALAVHLAAMLSAGAVGVAALRHLRLPAVTRCGALSARTGPGSSPSSTPR